MESVAAGSEFTFKLYLYEREHEYEATIERILGALQAGNIQLGGQKSNGCGYVEFKELLKIDYDMTRKKTGNSGEMSQKRDSLFWRS